MFEYRVRPPVDAAGLCEARKQGWEHYMTTLVGRFCFRREVPDTVPVSPIVDDANGWRAVRYDLNNPPPGHF